MKKLTQKQRRVLEDYMALGVKIIPAGWAVEYHPDTELPPHQKETSYFYNVTAILKEGRYTSFSKPWLNDYVREVVKLNKGLIKELKEKKEKT